MTFVRFFFRIFSSRLQSTGSITRVNLFQTMKHSHLTKFAVISGGLLALNEFRERRYFPLQVECSTRKNFSSERLKAIDSLNIIADVADEISPAVVSIKSKGSSDAIFLTRQVRASGSGFIVDKDGHIITNAHVVSKNRNVIVQLSNGKNYEATVLAVHLSHDLALLKIRASKSELSELPTLSFAPISEKNEVPVRPGQFVVAAGCPLEFKNSITVGVVSAIERDLGISEGIKYIQTDAIITFGNSGGPLVDLYGQVVGVNTMIAGTGLGFSIPVNNVVEFFQRAKDEVSKTPSKPHAFTDSGSSSGEKYLGIVMATIRLGPIQGIRIESVIENSPAERVGLQAGDIILSVNGKSLSRAQQIQDLIKDYDCIRIEVFRSGKKMTFDNCVPECL